MDKQRNAAIWTGIALVITLVLGYLLIADIGLPGGRPLTTLSPRGDKSQNIQDLIIPVFAIAGLVFIFVEIGLIWLARRFRRSDDDVDGVDEPEQVHGNTRLEIGWTVVPALLLAVLAVFNVQSILYMDDAEDPLEITVIGQQLIGDPGNRMELAAAERRKWRRCLTESAGVTHQHSRRERELRRDGLGVSCRCRLSAAELARVERSTGQLAARHPVSRGRRDSFASGSAGVGRCLLPRCHLATRGPPPLPGDPCGRRCPPWRCRGHGSGPAGVREPLQLDVSAAGLVPVLRNCLADRPVARSRLAMVVHLSLIHI